MKKIMVLFLTVVMLTFSLSLAGCNKVKATDENSYVISIYEQELEQEANGEVVFKGFKLKDSFRVVKTQMFEIKDYEEVEIDGEKVAGKYYYNNLPGDYIVVDGKKLQVFPNKDATIIFREREKKSINVYYNGQELSLVLNGDNLEYYNKNFKNIYNEHFVFYGDYVDAIAPTVEEDVKIELYTNANFTGEPFASGEFEYNYWSGFYGSFQFSLIKSTTVYIKLSYIN